MQSELNSDPDSLSHYGIADLQDILAADTVISFTEVGGGKGGRHVEFGYALALGKHMILVGPREHIFHTHPAVEHYADWTHLVMAMSRTPVGGAGVVGQ
jgi:hypothetical protein